ncbi:MAG: Fe-S cluster domain-containing protein [Nanoarchaeota archaeon]|nr:Fe-S cluster domain-containing protein [Nanoarchaeota archaeon]MBU1946243.1 Fe-S cluster domain-containing protein [Nanoarchaeota archaeon]
MIGESIIVLAGLGFGFGIFLAFASKKFHVKHDPKIDEVISVLPGANCGACGYAGCAAYAEAVVLNKEVPVDLCIPGQKAVADKVAQLLGREAGGKKTKLVAQLKCNGGKNEAGEKYKYNGVETCRSAAILSGGPKSCSYGCIGFGDCVNVCKFNALKMGANGLPVVDKAECVACGACVKACPKGLFKLVPHENKVHVLCSSKDLGKVVIKVCKVGCIACMLCVKACKFDAIHVVDNIAEIDYSKCTECGACVTACPRKIIVDERKR